MKIKNLFSGLKSKLISMYGKNKKLFIFTLALIILLIFCFVMYPKTNDEQDSNVDIGITSKSVSEKYEDEIELKLRQMLLSIDEVQSANVMVVCEASETYEYLKNITETTSGSGDSASKTKTEEVVYEKNGSNSNPIIVSEKKPRIVGVWIVINSVSASTKLAITNSISSVLNIDETSISILQGR